MPNRSIVASGASRQQHRLGTVTGWKGRAALAIAVVAPTLACPSASAHAVDDQPAGIKDLVGCTRVSDDAARLRCFDDSVRRLTRDIEGKRIAVLDGEKVKQTRRSLFGFSLPPVGLFGNDGPDNKEEITEIDGVISKLLRLPNQRFELVLGDGARWQTTEAANDPYDIGGKVHIRRGALGSYWIAGGHGPAIRGRRIN